jgi:hypothetical protein
VLHYQAKQELKAGPWLLRAKVTGWFYAAIDSGESWAVQDGDAPSVQLRNRPWRL